MYYICIYIYIYTYMCMSFADPLTGGASNTHQYSSMLINTHQQQ